MTERYEIVSQIGEDQLGSLYLADDTMLQRRVMFRHVEHGDSVAAASRGDSWRKDFGKFAGKLSTMQHPNLLTIYDISIEDSGAFVVTQFVKGDSLAERLERGALGQIGVYRMASDMLEALHAAHQSDVFHGALHTASISRVHRAAGGHRYLLVDLGLNQLVSMVKGEKVNVADPVLMAPELHVKNHQPDAKADLFMLGQLCYTALVGGHPYSGMSVDECVSAYRNQGVPPLEDYVEGVDSDFSKWVMSLLQFDPNDRPEDTGAAMVALHTIQINEPDPNVPGKTHAVAEADLPKRREITESVTATPQPQPAVSTYGSPSPQLNPPTSAIHVAAANSAARTQSVGVAGATAAHSMSVSIGEAQAKKGKKKMALSILSGVLVLMLIGMFVVLNNRGGDDQKAAATEAAEPQGIQILKVELVNTMAKQNTPVVVELDSAKSLDWLVTTGVPSPAQFTDKVDGLYIQSLQLIEVKKEYSQTNSPIRFKSGGRTLQPKASTGKGMGSKPGAGYELLLRVPAKQEQSVTVNVYMFQLLCDFRVEVEDPRSKLVEVKVIPFTEQGVIKIPIHINQPVPGDFYTIRVVSTSAAADGSFSLGLSGVSVEGR